MTDWLTNLLPILNAAGIPLLAIGVILLIRAYQKSVETYKETSSHLRDENERLRKRIYELDTSYFREVEKVRSVILKSSEVIEELNVRKVTLLSKAEERPIKPMIRNSPEKSDVIAINKAIELLEAIISHQRRNEIDYLQKTFYSGEQFRDIIHQLSMLTDRIGDIETKFTILKVLSEADIKQLRNKVGEQKRGLALTEEETSARERLENPSLPPSALPYVPEVEAPNIDAAHTEDPDLP